MFGSVGCPGGSGVITRTNTVKGQIDTLSRGGVQLVDYAYLGSRVAQRDYSAAAVDVDYGYDQYGRIDKILSAGFDLAVKCQYCVRDKIQDRLAAISHLLRRPCI